MQIQSGRSQLTIQPKGGVISFLQLDGQKLIEPNVDYLYESSWLFPFPNRLKSGSFSFEGQTFQLPHNDFGRPNALHGFIADVPFDLEKESEHKIVASMGYNASHLFYPFSFNFKVIYSLSDENLAIEILVENTGKNNMPCGLGWHPYFLTENLDDTFLKMPDTKEVEVDESLIPSGIKKPYYTFEQFKKVSGTKFDTCFKMRRNHPWHVTKVFSDNSCVLELKQDANFRFLQIFTPEDRKAIAIEPMTCGIDALNTGENMRVLSPSEVWEMRIALTLNKK